MQGLFITAKMDSPQQYLGSEQDIAKWLAALE